MLHLHSKVQDKSNISSYCQGEPKVIYTSLQRSMTIALSILEPVVYLPACAKKDTPPAYDEEDSPTQCSTCNNIIAMQPMIRGSLLLKLTKPTNIKKISLNFYGVSETQWPYYSSLDKGHTGAAYIVRDTVCVNSHEWNFVPAKQVSAEVDQLNAYSYASQQYPTTIIGSDIYGADIVQFKESGVVTSKQEGYVYHNSITNTIAGSSSAIPIFEPTASKISTPTTSKSEKHQNEILYPAGDYVFNFTIAIGPNVPETIRAQSGCIRYFLEPKVVHGGLLFGGHTRSGRLEVEVVRCPKSNIDNPIINNACHILKEFDNKFLYEIDLGSRYVTIGDKFSLTVSHKSLFNDVKVGEVVVEVLQYIKYTNSSTKKNSNRGNSVQLARRKYTSDHSKSYTPTVITKNFNRLNNSDSKVPICDPTLSPSLTISSDESNELSTPTDSAPVPHNIPMRTSIFDISIPYGSQTAILIPNTSCSPYIQVKHHLGISFKVSYPHPRNPGLRKQEDILIQVPIHLLSSKCKKDNLILPKYNPTNSLLVCA